MVALPATVVPACLAALPATGAAARGVAPGATRDRCTTGAAAVRVTGVVPVAAGAVAVRVAGTVPAAAELAGVGAADATVCATLGATAAAGFTTGAWTVCWGIVAWLAVADPVLAVAVPGATPIFSSCSVFGSALAFLAEAPLFFASSSLPDSHSPQVWSLPSSDFFLSFLRLAESPAPLLPFDLFSEPFASV